MIAQDRLDKVIVFKKRRRQNSRRRNGHRQHITVLRIGGITRWLNKHGEAKNRPCGTAVTAGEPKQGEQEYAMAHKKQAARRATAAIPKAGGSA